MQNKENWRPTKFNYKGGKLRASGNLKEVEVHSRLISDLIAEFYDLNIPEHARGKLLDLGCGNAPLFEAYKDHVTDSFCVDWGGSMHSNKYLDLEADLNGHLPLQDLEFDTIILSDVLEHIRHPELLWNEMFRVLAENGKLLMNVPFYYWIHEEPYDYFRYTEYALRSMAEEAGFNIIVLKPIGGSLEIFTDLTVKHIQFMPVVGVMFAKIIQRLTWAFIKTGIGKKISNATARKFPLGYYLIAEKPAS